MSEEKIITQHDVENKQLKEQNEKVKKEENEKVRTGENEKVTKEENEKVRKEENDKLRKEENEKLRNENEQLRKNNVYAKIKKSIEKPIEIKSPEEDKNTRDWFDRKKFEKILAIIDSKKFTYKNKIDEVKYINIKHLVNNIRNNTIRELSAKTGLNTLNELKNVGIIKQKTHTPKQKELLNLFNDLSVTILTDKTLMSSKDKK